MPRPANEVLRALRAEAERLGEQYAPAFALEDEFATLDDKTSERALEILVAWTRAQVERVGARGLVLGVSGGVDSTLAAIVCARTELDSVAYALPAHSASEDESLARALCEALALPFEVLDLSAPLDALLEVSGEQDAEVLHRGNLGARLRTAVLYLKAARSGRLVLGTADLDETYIGYGCKGSAADISPLIGLHKREVRALVRRALDDELGATLAARVASPGYFDGQRAEDELGMSYDVIAAGLDVIIPTCELSVEHGVDVRDSATFRARFDASSLDIEETLALADLVRAATHKTQGSPALFREHHHD